MFKKILFLLILLAIGTWGLVKFFTPEHAAWQTVSAGVEWRKIQIENAGFLKSDVEVTVLRVDPGRVHVEMGSAKTAEEWRRFAHGIAAINGGFFDEKNHSLGLRKSAGTKLSPLRHADWGVFFIQNGRAQILHTRDFPPVNSTDITEAIQCGPRLVVDGHPTDLKNQWARRTGIGIDARGKVLIAVCDSEVPLRDWAEFWAASGGLHCRQALNLDGGGSTQISLKSGKANLDIAGMWPVPDALVIR
jgi:uncharacterized protein YigE (DUF2233 family)